MSVLLRRSDLKLILSQCLSANAPLSSGIRILISSCEPYRILTSEAFAPTANRIARGRAFDRRAVEPTKLKYLLDVPYTRKDGSVVTVEEIQAMKARARAKSPADLETVES